MEFRFYSVFLCTGLINITASITVTYNTHVIAHILYAQGERHGGVQTFALLVKHFGFFHLSSLDCFSEELRFCFNVKLLILKLSQVEVSISYNRNVREISLSVNRLTRSSSAAGLTEEDKNIADILT